MYWSGGSGVHFVRGLIGQKFGSMGWESSAFGYPISDEFCGLLRGGCGQHFQRENGSIYWSPQTGAHRVQGLIKNRWAELDWENGPLGYPTSDEFVESGTVFQNFEGGWLAWEGGEVYGGDHGTAASQSKYGPATPEQFARARSLIAG